MNFILSFQLGEVEISNLTILVLAFFSSFTFIAVGIIGGAGPVLGPLFGAVFFSLIPGVLKFFLHFFGTTADQIPLHPTQIERFIFGLLLIGFLIFEPRGLWGIWFRLRNYFKAWPFSY